MSDFKDLVKEFVEVMNIDPSKCEPRILLVRLEVFRQKLLKEKSDYDPRK